VSTEYPEGTVLGDRFRLEGVLGSGGMATVYLAHDQLRDQRVALKLLHPHLARDPGMRRRLRREVLAASSLKHPGALLAHDLHELEGTWALSLPFHPGRTLAERVAEDGPLGADALRQLGLQLAEVLQAAHAQGILHRDVTPANVMLDRQGAAVLTDFGLAHLRDDGSTRGTGMLGTSGYAAPEVYAGVRCDPRSDLYSLGAVLYLAATGRTAFGADNPMGTLKRQMEGDFEPLHQLRPELPADLTATIEALLQQDIARRPQGAADLLAALQQHRAPETHLAPAIRGPARQLPEPRGLPPGDWTLVLKDPRSKPHRRALRGRGRRRRRHGPRVYADPAEQIKDIFLHLKKEFLSALGLPEETTPQRFLAISVAREAGLPDEALEVTPALFKRRFRLVGGVGRESAQRLGEAAREAGYQVQLRQGSKELLWRLKAALPAATPGLVMLVLAVFVFPANPSFFFLLLGAIFMLKALAAGVHGGAGAGRGLRDLPLAYGADLVPHVTAEHRHPLAAPAAPPEERPQEDERGEPPCQAILRRVLASLDALERCLDSQQDQLPDIALRDLNRSASELRGQAQALAERATTLERELSLARDPRADETAAALESRLARLRTLERAGEALEPVDQRRLEAEIASHREAQTTVAALERQQTATMASLLEIGATASRVRRQLLDEPDPARSAERAIERLRRQHAAAEKTKRELARGELARRQGARGR